MASVYISVKSKFQHPPWAPPRVFDFLENYCSNPPYLNQNAVQMPHTRVHSGDQMPPSRGDLKTFHIIHYVGALKARVCIHFAIDSTVFILIYSVTAL